MNDDRTMRARNLEQATSEYEQSLARAVAYQQAKELEADEKAARAVRICSQCESSMYVRTGEYGRYFACPGYPKCRAALPYTMSFGPYRGMPIDDVPVEHLSSAMCLSTPKQIESYRQSIAQRSGGAEE